MKLPARTLIALMATFVAMLAGLAIGSIAGAVLTLEVDGPSVADAHFDPWAPAIGGLIAAFLAALAGNRVASASLARNRPPRLVVAILGGAGTFLFVAVWAGWVWARPFGNSWSWIRASLAAGAGALVGSYLVRSEGARSEPSPWTRSVREGAGCALGFLIVPTINIIGGYGSRHDEAFIEPQSLAVPMELASSFAGFVLGGWIAGHIRGSGSQPLAGVPGRGDMRAG
jgi:hypothetical protein